MKYWTCAIILAAWAFGAKAETLLNTDGAVESNQSADSMAVPRPPRQTRTVTQSVHATIVEVQGDGQILLDNGMRLRQWAVSFTDIGAANDFLAGRYAYCFEVLSKVPTSRLPDFQGDIGVFDCAVTPFGPPPNLTPSYAWLSIYAWAAELGLGTPGCTEADIMPADVLGISHVSGFNYQCDGTRSIKQQLEVFLPSSE